MLLPKINDAPHISLQPHDRAKIRLVLPDQNWMWHWQQSNQRAILQELQDLTLVRQAFIDTDLFHLRHENLKETHDSLQWELVLPAGDPVHAWCPRLTVGAVLAIATLQAT